MSISEHQSRAPIADEIERAVRCVPAADETTTVFLEERSGLRLRLDSEGERALSMTSSRGVAVGGAVSRHLSDPGPGQIEALAAGGLPTVGRLPSTGEIGSSARDSGHPRSDAAGPPTWLARLEERLTDRLRREGYGLTGAVWIVEVTASRQIVWVVGAEGRAREDVRWTGRIELRAGFDGHPNSVCVTDLPLVEPACPDLTDLLASTLARAERRRGRLLQPAKGPTTVILGAGLGGIVVHELVGHALEGDVRARGPVWIDRPERLSGPRSLTVVDDPGAGRAPWKFDDEAVIGARVALIDDGRPVGSLLDRRTARALGRRSNGHGRRSSFLDPPLPRMGCTFIAAGTDDAAELERETESALFIHRMTAGHTDPKLGRASFVVAESDRIQGGQRVTPLAPFVIEIDGAKAWRTIDRIGNDLVFDRCIGSCVREGQPLAVSVGAPTIRIGVINVVA